LSTAIVILIPGRARYGLALQDGFERDEDNVKTGQQETNEP
jgi:hypothetical protein